LTDYRQQAAVKALEYVKNGMVVGLGSGATASYFIEALGAALRSGELMDIYGVPTSTATAELALACGIPLTNLAEHAWLDLAVDGADEVDPDLNLIKGLGRALMREKIVEIHARKFIVVVDDSKLVNRLGTRGPVPVEILAFAAEAHVRWLNSLGCQAELWVEENGSPIRTDNGHYIARCWFLSPDGSLIGIPDAYDFDRRLAGRPGILEHGLFLDMASIVIVAGAGGVRIMERK
jgi:ribose 5-phosphate isomerase A